MAKVNQRELPAGQRIRVMVVDDSALARRLVTQALEREPAMEVVGSAANGLQALERVAQWQPDLLTLDVEMPEMDGLETLRRLRRTHRQLRVIMFSSLTERSAAVTMEALTSGADDYVTKPTAAAGSMGGEMAFRETLVPKILQFFRLPGTAPRPAVGGDERAGRARRPAEATAGGDGPVPVRRTKLLPQVLAIGVSTGGPNALAAVLPGLPADFPLPVLVVQHMPAVFTTLLAERLQAVCRLAVREARAGEKVIPGTILLAPGDFHLKVVADRGAVRVSLDQAPPLNSCRPAVDALFASVGEAYGGGALAVVLTGMGQDGLRGARTLHAQGATVLAQDEATSVVWGMPGAVVKAGVADRVLPLDRVAPEILRIVGRE